MMNCLFLMEIILKYGTGTLNEILKIHCVVDGVTRTYADSNLFYLVFLIYVC